MKLKSILMATAIMILTSCGLFAQNSKNSKKIFKNLICITHTDIIDNSVNITDGKAEQTVMTVSRNNFVFIQN